MANTIQIKRSSTSGNTPTLAAGELGVNLADSKLYVGNGSTNVLLNPSASTNYLPLTGGTLTGNLNANGLVSGVWSGNGTFRGIFHSAQTGSEYCLISNDTNTILSASTGYGVFIRGGNNVSTYQIGVYPNQLPTAGGNTILTTASGLQLSGGTLTGQLYSQTIRPSANATFNLGVATGRYAYIYGVTGDFSGNVTVAGSCTFAALSGTTATFSGDLDLADNSKIKLGDSNDLQIFHDGSHSYIKDTGTGSLYIQGGPSVQIENASGANMAVFTSGGAAELYHNNAKKFETTSTGATVTGDLKIGASGADAVRHLRIDGTNGSSETAGFILENDGANAKVNFKYNIGNGTPATKLTIDHSGNLTGTGTLGTNASRWSTIYGAAGNLTGQLTITENSTSGKISAKFSNTNTATWSYQELQGWSGAGYWRLGVASEGYSDPAARKATWLYSHGGPLLLGANNSDRAWLTATSFYPSTSGHDLGTNAQRWQLYATSGDVSGNLTVSGSCTFAALSGTTADFSGSVEVGGALDCIKSGTNVLTIQGSSSGYVNAGISLRATSDTHYRGLGVFMHDAGGDTEWFAGRPYADSDKYIIARKASQASHSTATAQTSNSLFTIASTGAVTIGATLTVGDTLLTAGGSDANLRLRSDSSRSGLFIDKPGTTTVMGSALVLASDESYRLGTQSYYHVVCQQGGGTLLYYQGNTKLTTTSYGADITGRLVTTSHIDAPDNARIRLGDGDDLQLYHDGTNSYIDNNTGQLFINKNGPSNVWLCGGEGGILNADGSEYMLRATNNGSVKLYYDNSIKFETASTGVSITGTVTSSGNVQSASKLTVTNGSHQMNVGIWDGATHRVEGDANRPLLLTSYNAAGVKIGVSGGTTATVNSTNVKIVSSSPTLNIANSSVNNFESGRIRFTEADMGGSPYFQGAFLHYDGSGNQFYIGVHNTSDSNTANDIRSIQLSRGTGNITLLKNTTVNTNLTVAGSCTFAALSGTSATFSGDLTASGTGTINGVRLGRGWHIANRAGLRLDSNGTSYPADILFGHTPAANESSWNGVYWSLSSRGANHSPQNAFYFYRGSGHASPNNSEATIMTFTPDLKVGINDTNPSATLDVTGTGNFSSNLTVGGTTILNGNVSINHSYNGQSLNISGNIYTIGGSNWVNNGQGFVSSSSTNTGVYPHSTSGVSLNVAGSTKFNVNSTGASVTDNLTVGGNLHVAGSAIVGRTNDQGSYPNDDYDLFVGNGNSGTRILLYNDSGNYHSALINYDTNCLKLGLNNSNSADSLLTTTAVNITNTGVGIGTAAPDSKLDIRSTTGTVGLTVGNTTGDTRLQITSSENSDVTLNVGDAAGMGTSRSFIFKTGSSERMRIEGANVSIGSTSSAYGRLFVDAATTAANTALAIRGRDSSASYIALNVINNADGAIFSILNNGKAELTHVGGADLDILTLDNNRNTQYDKWGIKFQDSFRTRARIQAVSYSTGNAGGALAFETGYSTDTIERMRLSNFGNLGIGTDNPTQPLTLKRSSAGQGEFGLRFEFEDTNGPTATSSAILVGTYGLKFKNYNSSRDFIFETGNVGIGGTPSASFHLQKASASQPFARFEDTGTNTNPAIGIKNDAQEWLLQTVGARSDNFEVWDQTNGATRLAIATGGTVSLGAGSFHAVGGTPRLYLSGQTNMIVMSQPNVFNNSSYIRHWGTAHFQWQTYNGSNAGILELEPYGGSVGIGTGGNSPSAKLHVVASTDDGIRINSNNAIIGQQTTHATHGTQLLFWDGTDAYLGRSISGLGNGTVTSWNIRTGGADKVIINSTGLGIGGTPAYELEVAGSISNFGDGKIIRLRSNDYIIGQIENRGTGADYDKGYFRLFDTGTAKVVLDSAGSSFFTGGSVGIGIASPSVSLDIVSTDAAPIKLYRNSGNCSVHIKNSGDDVYVGVNTYNNVCLGHNLDQTTAPFQLTSSGSLGLGTASADAKLHAVSTQCDILAESTTANQATRLRLKTTSHEYRIGTQGASDNFWIYDVDAADYRFVLDPNGQCGIGTASPSAKLHVSSGSSSQSLLTGADELVVEGSDHAGITILAPAARRSQLYFNSDAFLRWVDNDGVFSIDTSASASKIAIGPSGADVGIGTSSPSAKLHVFNDNIDTRGSNVNASTVQIYFDPTNGNSAATSNTLGSGITWKPNYGGYSKRSAGIVQIGEGNYFRSGLAFYTNSTADHSTDWSERMRIGSDGLVGIGVTDPTEMLHIKKSDGTGSFIRFEDTGGGGVYVGARSNEMELYAGGAERLRISTSGNITSPDSDTYASFGRARVGYIGHSDYAGFAHYDHANASSYGFLQGYQGATFINSAAGQTIYFRQANANVGGIVSGNWGLGTISPGSYKLYVNGTSYFANTANFKSQINLITVNNITRGFIKATDTDNAHLIIATSGGEDICFKDDGVNGTTNMTILGNGDIKLNGYGGGSRTGTVAKYLAVKSDGVIIEDDLDWEDMPNISTLDALP